MVRVHPGPLNIFIPASFEMIERLLSEIEVTPENLPALREKIGFIREEKGREEEVLQLIKHVRERAIIIEAHEDVVNLYWEEYLVGKHILMYARDSGGLKPSRIYNMASGFFRMRSSANKADEYIEGHSVDNLRARSHRFLGEVAMIESAALRKPPIKAEEHFAQAVDEFRKHPDFEMRKNYLELSGFLAEAMVLNGKTDEALELAKETFQAYDDGDGTTLKATNYYEWAVWKSGCVTKLSHALIYRGVDLDEEQKRELKGMLDMASFILDNIPEGLDLKPEGFQIRREDVAAAKAYFSG